MAKKKTKKETAKKEKLKKDIIVQEQEEIKETGSCIKPAVKKATGKLLTIEKPMGRSAVRSKKLKSTMQVKEVEVIKEVELVKEVEKKSIVPYICLQYLGGESDINEIVESAKKVWQENNHSGEEFQSIDLYVKPEDNAAYYVINGTDTGKVDLGL